MIFMAIFLALIGLFSIVAAGIGIYEYLTEIRHDLKTFDRFEHDLHVKHLAKGNGKRIV